MIFVDSRAGIMVIALIWYGSRHVRECKGSLRTVASDRIHLCWFPDQSGIILVSLSEKDSIVGPDLSPFRLHQWIGQGGRAEALGKWIGLLCFWTSMTCYRQCQGSGIESGYVVTRSSWKLLNTWQKLFRGFEFFVPTLRLSIDSLLVWAG